MMGEPQTAEDLLVAVLEILQRELPGGDLGAREAIAELWGVLESPAAAEILGSGSSGPRQDDHKS